MVISQYDLGVGLNPQVVAAIVAAIFQILDEENKPSSSYVPKKSKNWKELGKHERCWVLRLRR
ncbi:MAG TPA: hypothetical protein PK016_02315 [Candidatus Atribacteria bacterium]|nr:hypothetical protein [Candidatus Atribacteria bacterium]